MKIDLNNLEEVKFENVAALIASKDDSRNRQLRISQSGEAYLSDDVAFQNIEGVAVRFETWAAGGGYTGPEAAKDSRWVNRILKALQDNWPPKPGGSYVDIY